MAKKVSKNSKVASRAASAGSGKDYVKIVSSIKDATTGTYSYKQMMVHKDKVKEFLADKK
jgi:hypothetical protein